MSSFVPWFDLPKKSYTVSTTTNTLLKVHNMDHNSKFDLRLLIMDTNGNVIKISINSLDLSKFLLIIFINNFYK